MILRCAQHKQTNPLPPANINVMKWLQCYIALKINASNFILANFYKRIRSFFVLLKITKIRLINITYTFEILKKSAMCQSILILVYIILVAFRKSKVFDNVIAEYWLLFIFCFFTNSQKTLQYASLLSQNVWHKLLSYFIRIFTKASNNSFTYLYHKRVFYFNALSIHYFHISNIL